MKDKNEERSEPTRLFGEGMETIQVQKYSIDGALLDRRQGCPTIWSPRAEAGMPRRTS